MYDIKYIDGEWRITKDGKPITIIDGFEDPISPKIIIEEIEKNGEISEEAKEKVRALLRQSFRPEFLNRLDEIIIYKPLKKEEITQILDLLLESLSKRLEEENIKFELTDAAKNYLIENGYDERYGARPLKRFVTKNLETLLAEGILTGDIKYKSKVMIDFKDNKLVIVK